MIRTEQVMSEGYDEGGWAKWGTLCSMAGGR